MTNEALYKLLEENELTTTALAQWKELIEIMDEEDKREFGNILTQQEKEKNILTTRQSNELIDLMHRWKIENSNN